MRLVGSLIKSGGSGGHVRCVQVEFMVSQPVVEKYQMSYNTRLMDAACHSVSHEHKSVYTCGTHTHTHISVSSACASMCGRVFV